MNDSLVVTLRRQIEENVNECDERIANNDAVRNAYMEMVNDETKRVLFELDKTGTLNPEWVGEAVDIAANLNLEGFDNAIYEDAFKNGMRHALDLLEKAINEPKTLDGCCDNCGGSKPEDDGKLLCAECEKEESFTC